MGFAGEEKPPFGGTWVKPQAENVLHDTGEMNSFSVTLTRQRIVEAAAPLQTKLSETHCRGELGSPLVATA